MNRFYPFAVVITIAVFVVTVLATGATFTHFLSLPALIVVVVPTLAMSLANFSLAGLGRCFSIGFRKGPADRSALLAAKAYFEAVGRYLVVSGALGLLIGVIVLLAYLGGDPSVIGAGTAVALLTVLYAVLLYILVPVPFGVGIRRKLAEIDGTPRS
jgi:flagellar motor component MotA